MHARGTWGTFPMPQVDSDVVHLCTSNVITIRNSSSIEGRRDNFIFWLSRWLRFCGLRILIYTSPSRGRSGRDSSPGRRWARPDAMTGKGRSDAPAGSCDRPLVTHGLINDLWLARQVHAYRLFHFLSLIPASDHHLSRSQPYLCIAATLRSAHSPNESREIRPLYNCRIIRLNLLRRLVRVTN